ncbi:HpcH/HpaI aldolase-like protein 1 [Elsinoe australis]|uniref:HpcH/HpaI aldolase-like protein 1 n=1 Tax=Elsinoe australis TaxID=40998 RepID=A0A4U7B8R5_9PEZI|nr:HpcH/HpaI aldolase-like protein 1 [Elsinoe australis]
MNRPPIPAMQIDGDAGAGDLKPSAVRQYIELLKLIQDNDIELRDNAGHANSKSFPDCSEEGRSDIRRMLPGTNVSRAIARTGFDWICVDTEHGNISDDSMHECVAAIAACGVSPIVRVAANEPWMVKRALDAGAHGIIVPLLKTAEDAKQIVSSAKFPPDGTRGFGSPFSMEKFHTHEKGAIRQTDYYQQANQALVTVIQIETKEALKNVDEIANVPGVDVLLIGPFDLGNNIGYPIIDGMHDELKNAISKIHESAKKAGKRTGIYCTSGDQAREYADRGFHMISVVTDAAALPQACDAALKAALGSEEFRRRNMSYA